MALRRSALLCLAGLVGFGPNGVIAQERTESLLSGLVVDASTGVPIRGAILRMPDGQAIAITNAAGAFRVASVAPGRYEIEIGTTGYVTARVRVLLPTEGVQRFTLEPAPIDLGEIAVTVAARLEQRRMAAPSRVIVYDQAELQAAISPDIGAFLKSRGAAQFTGCPGQFAPADLPNCYVHRGSNRRFVVYLDDAPQLKAVGTSNLWAFDPHNLWVVEFLPDCGELRIYTTDFRDRVSRGAASLRPVLCEPVLR